MKIKHKLTLGVGLLFLLILVLSVVGASSINILRNDTENILVANYNTLEYSRNMLLALDDIPTDKNALRRFERNLSEQQKNLTEIGEREATEALIDHFNQFKQSHSEELYNTLSPQIRKDISTIMRLNMEAIRRKSKVASQTAASATLWIVMTGTCCFIIAFTLLINLPNNIANPIRELTASISGIAARNYHQRVHFESHNEFGELARSFNVMAKKLEEYNNSNLYQLLLENKRIETLINNMSDPVIGLDESHVILFANEGASAILGLKPEELIGKQSLEIALHNDLMRNLIQHIPENGQSPVNDDQPLKIYAHQKESYFQKEIVPIHVLLTGEQVVKHIGHFIVLKNITTFKELDSAKTHFIATVSHELKTPISSIKMSLQLLENEQIGSTNEEQRQLLKSIREDSERLLKITGELLDLSQVETGNIQLNSHECDAAEIAHYAMDAVKTQLEQKFIELQVRMADNLPTIRADHDKTAWVLINFLTNAIRYSPERSKITIEISPVNDRLQFSVSDQGTGIEERYLDKIFDRYFQIPGSQRTGTGLGLSISKEFIEAQGGKIHVSSIPGTGSTFSFELPVLSQKLLS